MEKRFGEVSLAIERVFQPISVGIRLTSHYRHSPVFLETISKSFFQRKLRLKKPQSGWIKLWVVYIHSVVVIASRFQLAFHVKLSTYAHKPATIPLPTPFEHMLYQMVNWTSLSGLAQLEVGGDRSVMWVGAILGEVPSVTNFRWEIEMCMGMRNAGFPSIPWNSHANGNQIA